MSSYPPNRFCVAAAAAMLLLSGCTTGLTGQQEAAGPPVPPEVAGLPVADPREFVVGDEALAWDPCALHDPSAAERATGQQKDQLQPGTGLTECVMRTAARDGNSWNLYARVEPFADVDAEMAAPLDVGGARVYRTDTGGGQCQYQFDMGSGTALTLSAQAGGGSGHPEIDSQACGIGERYLREVIPWWITPAHRGSGATTPAITLGTQGGPCEAIRDAVEKVPAREGTFQTTVQRDDPYQCSVTDMVPDPKSHLDRQLTRAEIAFEVNSDPESLASQGVYPPVEVAGHPGVVQAPDPQDPESLCTVTVRASDEVIDMDLKQAGKEVIAPLVRVQAPACDQATALATTAVQAALS